MPRPRHKRRPPGNVHVCCTGRGTHGEVGFPPPLQLIADGDQVRVVWDSRQGAVRVLAKRRLPGGVAGMARLHEMIGQQLDEDAGDAEVVIGIETNRGPWVLALAAAGHTVYGVNPLQASRYRERHGMSGAMSDGADAHMLTDMVRTDSHQLRAVAGGSAGAEGVKVLARTHKTMIW